MTQIKGALYCKNLHTFRICEDEVVKNHGNRSNFIVLYIYTLTKQPISREPFLGGMKEWIVCNHGMELNTINSIVYRIVPMFVIVVICFYFSSCSFLVLKWKSRVGIKNYKSPIPLESIHFYTMRYEYIGQPYILH